MDLEHVFKIVRRRAWVIVLCFVLVTVGAFAFSKTRTREYTATASLVFNGQSAAAQASGAGITAQPDPTGQRSTNLELVQLSAVVPRIAAKTLNDGITPAQVQGSITAAVENLSNVISVSATWPNPVLAARIANAFTNAFIAHQTAQDQATIQNAINLVNAQIRALPRADRRTPQGQSLLDHVETLRILSAMDATTQLVHAAAVPSAPSSPNVSRNTVIGAVFGLLLGFALAFLLDRFDRRLREPGDIEQALGLPMLGLIPHAQLGAGPGGGAASVDLEPFRMLRAHLRYFNVDRELKILLVTSAQPGEGKTTIAFSLASAAASIGTRALLIEADLRKPSLSRELILQSSHGLAGALVSTQPYEDAVQHVDVEERTNVSGTGRFLDVIPAGGTPPNPAELLESHAMQNLLRWAAERYELIIVDTPPLSAVADSIPLMTRVDGVIVVSRLGLSTRDGSERLRERLDTLGAPLLGVVINDTRLRSGSGYGYGYGYGYGPGSKNGAAPSSDAGAMNGEVDDSGPEPAHSTETERQTSR